MASIEKVNAEIARLKAKISELQARLRDCERQKTELENSSIVELVRSLGATPGELQGLLATYRQTGIVALKQREEEPEIEK